MTKTILVVEDDQMLQKLIATYLNRAGFQVVSAMTGKEAIERFHQASPCFIILDLMIPEISGEDVCRYVRVTQNSDVPIIMVTAKIDEQERINGLKMGADDYITKPFSPDELVVRIESVLRRAGHYCQKVRYGNLELRPNKHEIWLGSEQVHLTISEFAILKEFMMHPNQVLSREQLLHTLYPYQEKDVFERTIDVHVKNIREKLGEEIKSSILIQTIRGVGYKLVVRKGLS